MKYICTIGIVFSGFMALSSHGYSRLWWSVLLVGTLANVLVVGANEWKMPVRGGCSVGLPRHASMTKGTRLKWLADVIPTGMGKASAGDFMIAAGLMGLAANFQQLTIVQTMALLWATPWTVGWSGGFNLFTKWTREERKDARKNFPIVLLLLIAGNLLRLHGCSTPELKASAKNLLPAPEVTRTKLIKQPATRIFHASHIAPVPLEVLRELRTEDTNRRARENAEMAQRTALAIVPQIRQLTHGPACHITCSGCHGRWDAETLPEFCKANWISPNWTTVPGWAAIGNNRQESGYFNGPAMPGWENYKLYWTKQDDRP